MKERDRAYRRQQDHKNKKKVVNQDYWACDWDKMEEKEKKKCVGIASKTKKHCSCDMCGHHRETLGETMQEKKQDIKDSDLE